MDEWLDYVASDPEIQRDPFNGPNDFLLVAHPEEPTRLWYNPGRGNIHTKNPDDFTISKMIAIAEKLGAHVQGDEGELYNTESFKAEFPPIKMPAVHNPREHAKELLKLFEKYCHERPDIVGNWRGLKCAKEPAAALRSGTPEQEGCVLAGKILEREVAIEFHKPIGQEISG
jgi:hypothetical protein